MDVWILFWTIVIIIGIGAFVGIVVAIIPLGARDIWVLLHRLGKGDERRAEEHQTSDSR
jgi:hypothetical protein